jgi:hypothetical protein
LLSPKLKEESKKEKKIDINLQSVLDLDDVEIDF